MSTRNIKKLEKAINRLCDLEAMISGSTVSDTTSYWIGYLRGVHLLLLYSNINDMPAKMYRDAEIAIDYCVAELEAEKAGSL